MAISLNSGYSAIDTSQSEVLLEACSSVAAKAIAQKVLENISFRYVYRGTDYRTFNEEDQERIKTHIIGKLVDVLPTFGDRFLGLFAQSAENAAAVCSAIAGVCEKTPPIMVSTGKGLRLTALSKLYFDISKLRKARGLFATLSSRGAQKDTDPNQAVNPRAEDSTVAAYNPNTGKSMLYVPVEGLPSAKKISEIVDEALKELVNPRASTVVVEEITDQAAIQ